MKPIVHGANTPLDLGLFDCKRLYAYGDIKFECPTCKEVFSEVDLSEGDALEYGSFYSPSECYECGQEFDQVDYEITAEITIKIKGE